MAMYYNGKKVRNLYYNGKCITRLALGKEMTRLVEGDDFVRAEWLKGDGTALFNKSINFQSAKWELSNVTKYAALNDFQFNAETYAAFQIVAYPYNRTGIGIFDNTGGRGYLYTDVENVNVIKIQSQTTSGSIVINETDFSNPTLTIKPYFNLNRAASGDVKCSSITIDGVERYIPCRLLRPIPATLDGNGIARNAGDCGMFDAVSGKFFGNVAASGTFTVEPSLIEGVDYERHKWLVGNGSAYIKIKGYTRNEHWAIRTKCRVRGAGGSSSYSQIYGAVYYNDIYGSWALFTTKDVTVIAARGSSLSNYYDNYYDYNYNDVVSIIDEHNNISINNISKSTIADRVYFDNDEFWLFSTFDSKYLTANPASRIADADISQFTITENGTTVLDLIPCRLLRPIPASLDGNGIARNAGECGMYDAVSGKFYGNVASSGSFTVLD